jgi:hypothetical protein
MWVIEQKNKKTVGWTWGQTRQNLFDSDRSRAAVELKSDQSNQGWTLIDDRVILDL